MLKLSSWDVFESSLNPPTTCSSSLKIKTNKYKICALIKSGLIFSYLPSLLPFSVMTALTRRETSVQVLDPSQWARQTAPLPNEIQVRSVVEDKTDISD